MKRKADQLNGDPEPDPEPGEGEGGLGGVPAAIADPQSGPVPDPLPVPDPQLVPALGVQLVAVDEEEAELPVLAEDEIAALDRDGVQAAITARDGGVGNVTDDLNDLEFRRDALDVLPSTDWILSVPCADFIAAWLAGRAALVQDRIDMINTRQLALAGAVDQLTAQRRAEVWQLVTERIQLPVQQDEGGCEYLAHAICEVIRDTYPAIARRRLKKCWLIANSARLNPPHNWRHHVAPLLDCADGWWAIDPLLNNHGPLTRANWLAAARGTAAAAGLVDRDRPWELMGCSRADVAGFETDTLMPADEGSLARTSIDQCKLPAQ